MHVGSEIDVLPYSQRWQLFFCLNRPECSVFFQSVGFFCLNTIILHMVFV